MTRISMQFQSVIAVVLSGSLALSQPLSAQQEVPVVDLEQAVAATIESNYFIRLGKTSTDFGEGQLTTAEGDFDWSIVSGLFALRERLPPLSPWVDGTDTNNWVYSVGVQKKLRNGVLLSPRFGTDAFEDPDLSDRHWVTRGAINFDMQIPLARGASEVSAAANELFARKDLDGRYALYRHQIAGGVLDTVSAYWECVRATQSLQILRESEQEAEQMEAVVLRLAKLQLFSLAYVEQAQSNSREKKTRRINAELEQYKTRQTLGVSMGLDGVALAVPPVPAERVPELKAPNLPATSEHARVIRYAQEHREDLIAAQLNREAQATLTRAARKDLQPRVDLTLQLSYDGIDQGQRPQAFLFNDHDGLRVMGGVSMEFPLENRVQSGNLRQQLADEEAASVLRGQIAQTIASEVMVALEEAASTYHAYQVSQDAEKYFAEAVVKERKRFLVGDADFVDVVALTDGHRDARLATIAARQAHLVALARLRFASGTLVEGSAASGSVQVNQFTEVPAFE